MTRARPSEQRGDSTHRRGGTAPGRLGAANNEPPPTMRPALRAVAPAIDHRHRFEAAGHLPSDVTQAQKPLASRAVDHAQGGGVRAPQLAFDPASASARERYGRRARVRGWRSRARESGGRLSLALDNGADALRQYQRPREEGEAGRSRNTSSASNGRTRSELETRTRRSRGCHAAVSIRLPPTVTGAPIVRRRRLTDCLSTGVADKDRGGPLQASLRCPRVPPPPHGRDARTWTGISWRTAVCLPLFPRPPHQNASDRPCGTSPGLSAEAIIE